MVGEGRSISIRVSVEEYDLVKSLEGSFSEIWRLGFEKWAMEHPDFLQRRASEYQKLYIQCIDKLGKVYTLSIQKNTVLDDLYKIYITQGRSIDHPSHEDKSWVKARLGKVDNGHRVSVEGFFEYCRKRYLDEKQRKLEVEE